MASFTLIGSKWRALVRRKGYPAMSKYFAKRSEAERWAKDVEGRIDYGAKVLTPRAEQETIAQLIDKYRRLRASTRPILDTTTEHYTLKQLTRSLGPIVAAAMTVDDLLGWAQQRRDEGAGPYTINCDLSKLGTVIRYAGNGLPDVIGAARPKLAYLGLIGGGGLRERRPTEDELQRVLAWLASEKGPVYADAALFAAITAMRRGEIVALLHADVDRVKKLVLVEEYRRTLCNILSRSKASGQCNVQRDELFVIFNYTVGGMNPSPTTFTRFLGHKQIEVKPVSVYNKIVRGIPLIWKHADKFPELLKAHFSDMKVKA